MDALHVLLGEVDAGLEHGLLEGGCGDEPAGVLVVQVEDAVDLLPLVLKLALQDLLRPLVVVLATRGGRDRAVELLLVVRVQVVVVAVEGDGGGQGLVVAGVALDAAAAGTV